MPFVSRTERTISAGHYAGPEGHRCRTQHGHDFQIVVEFSYDEPNPATGWGPDFGAVKRIIDQYDHQNLNDCEPFNLGIPASSENLASTLFDQLKFEFGFAPDFVEVHEGAGNSVRYRR